MPLSTLALVALLLVLLGGVVVVQVRGGKSEQREETQRTLLHFVLFGCALAVFFFFLKELGEYGKMGHH
jgi:hypothetical protein